MTGRFLAGLHLLLPLLLGVTSLQGQVREHQLAAMQARSIGPAGMSGRIAAIDALATDPDVVYVGAATGGVWKSTNGGQTWKAVFDDQRVLGIGAVVVDQSNPDVVWVGTGEGNPRNSAGVGGGVYKSIDGGDTWTLLGLERSERIHRILLHPTDADIAYVGAMGPAWSDGKERGVFKTLDGGRSWERILYVDERTGVSDMVMDPTNPDKLIVGMWSFRRSPWFFESGGPGSGLYVTVDGGASWRRADEADGLPGGDLGRIGLAMYPTDPRIVYALVEARESALLRSSDGGRSWRTVRSGTGVSPRPFYYSDIFVDPENELRLYQLHSRLERSDDGGRTFENMGQGVHPDFHALWIDPRDPQHLYAGTDGGVYVSRDRGASWRMIDNLPVGQLYHVSVDMDVPYNVYGGMQDNGSWEGPSDVWESGGIRNYHWKEVAFGNGFGTLVDTQDPSYGYAMSQGGDLIRFDVRTGERKRIRPWAPDSTRLRFNWNAAIAADPYIPGGIYYGSQFVHKSVDRGGTWQIISADLTTNDPDKQKQEESGGLTKDATGAENHTTILTIAPSALSQDVVWVGTDDGKVQVTSSAGGQWYDVTDGIGGVPDNSWVAHIEASKFREGGAFAVFDDHRRGDWEPYIYRTDDYGDDWDRIADEDDIDGYVHTLEQDPRAEELLFAGTEFGLYVTLNGGDDWFKWTHGLPSVPVRSLVIHPRDHDLVIGTHGRAIYVLDDIRPLRELATNPGAADVALFFFEPPVAYVHTTAEADGYHFVADAMYQGRARKPGALFSYWLGEDNDDGHVTIEVLDFEDHVVRTLQGTRSPGLNRVSWDLREDLPEVLLDFQPTGGGGVGSGRAHQAPQVLPGTYTVRITRGRAESRQSLDVLPDPRVEIEMTDRITKYQALKRAQELNVRVTELQRATNSVREGVDRVLRLLESDARSVGAELVTSGQRLQRRLEEVADFEGVDQYRSGVSGLSSSYDAPTEGQRIDLIRMEEALDILTERINDFLLLDVTRFRNQVEAADLDVFPSMGPIG